MLQPERRLACALSPHFVSDRWIDSSLWKLCFMKTLFFRVTRLLTMMAIGLVSSHCVIGQGAPNPKLFGAVPSPSIAKLTEVVQELKLTSDQQQKVSALNAEMSAKRMSAFQDAQGDFEKMGRDIRKIYNQSHKSLLEVMDPPQRKRMQEIYVQVNSSALLLDDDTMASLKITDEQKKKLEKGVAESRDELFESFGEWQSLSEADRNKRAAEMIDKREKAMIAILSESQRTDFEKSKGEALEIDLSKIPFPGRE